MKKILLAFVVAVAAAVAMVVQIHAQHTVDETSLACSTDETKRFSLGSSIRLTRLPLNGTVYECTSPTTECIDPVILGQLYVDKEFFYLGNVDYYNTLSTVRYEEDGSISEVDSRTSELDYLQFMESATGIVRIRTFQVFGRVSVPSVYIQNRTTLLVGGYSDFVNALVYEDLDGDLYLTEYVLTSDLMKLTSLNGFTGTCTDYVCRFTVKPSQLKTTLRLIRYDYFQTVTDYNRLQLSVANKYQENLETEIGEICFTLTHALAKIHVYVTLQHNGVVTRAPTSSGGAVLVEPSYLYQIDTNQTTSGIVVDGPQYSPYNPYTFSSTGGELCVSTFDTFNITATYYDDEIDDVCFTYPEISVEVCLRDVRKTPRVPDEFNVTEIYLGEPRTFKITVFDANDETYSLIGEGQLSTYAFFSSSSEDGDEEVPIILGEGGIVFGQTRLATGAIYDSYCENILDANVVYSTNVFCYVSTLPGAYETVFYGAVDNVGSVSNTGIIVFDPPHDLYSCSAFEDGGLDGPCTSSGEESNNRVDHYIPILIEVTDSANTRPGFRIVIETLPRHGKLYFCGDIDCRFQTTREVSVGDYLKGRYGIKQYLWYRGDNDYFNYVVYDTREIGGPFQAAYRQCVVDCEGSRQCEGQCAIQLANDKAQYTSEYIYSFIDRKNVPFWRCYHEVNYGCPDTFTFSVVTPRTTLEGNVYNIYVENIPSFPTFTYSGGDIEYVPGVEKKFSIQYEDPDLDTWDIAVEFNMGLVTLGTDEAVDLYVKVVSIPANTLFPNQRVEVKPGFYVPVSALRDPETTLLQYFVPCFDTGMCGGKFFVVGIPSDVKFFLSRLKLSYFSRRGYNQFAREGIPANGPDDPTDGSFTVKYLKQYNGGVGRTRLSIPLYNDYDSFPVPISDFQPALTINYRVKTEFRDMRIDLNDPPDPLIQALFIIVEIVITLLIPIPPSLWITFAVGEALSKLTSMALTAATRAVSAVFKLGAWLVKGAGRLLLWAIGSGGRLLVQKGITKLSQFAARRSNLPRSVKFQNTPQVPRPSIGSIDDIRFVPKTIPNPSPGILTRITKSFSQYGPRTTRRTPTPAADTVPAISKPPLRPSYGTTVTTSVGKFTRVVARSSIDLGRRTLLGLRAFTRFLNNVRKFIGKKLKDRAERRRKRMEEKTRKMKDRKDMERAQKKNKFKKRKPRRDDDDDFGILKRLFRKILKYLIRKQFALLSAARKQRFIFNSWILSALSTLCQWASKFFGTTQEIQDEIDALEDELDDEESDYATDSDDDDDDDDGYSDYIGDDELHPQEEEEEPYVEEEQEYDDPEGQTPRKNDDF